jgi:spermidine synthase
MTIPDPRADRRHLWLAAAAFFASGAAALVYQVSWQRILALHSGVGIYSIAMIVGAFMAGLGGGSHLGGMLTTKVGPHRALLAFVGLELGIAGFGVVSCFLYYDLLYLRAAWLYAVPWRAGVIHFLSLLLPTTLMGMSLPFLVRGMVTDARGAGRTIGLLYGINVLGASVGALVTPWVLVRLLGVRGAVLGAVACNLAAAAIAAILSLARRTVADSGAPQPPASVETPGVEAAGSRPLALWAALYATSGFAALSLEMLWFRVLDVAVKSTPFTFGTVLHIYLLGSAVGSMAGALLVSRLRRPLAAFLLCQATLLAYSGAALALVVRAPAHTPLLRWLVAYWGQTDPFALGASWDAGPLLGLYLAFPLALYGPPTVLMGLSFPILQRAVHDDPRTSGRKVGLLQAANIAGCVVGSLLVGLVLLSWLGTAGSMRLLMVLGLALAGLGIWACGARSSFVAAAIALLALVVGFPREDRVWERLHGAGPATALVGEDATGVAAILEETPRLFRVYVNGKSHSWLPYGGVHTRLGAMPAVIHPAPVDVAIIGLGSGDTAWAVACRPETRTLTVFEISGPQPRLLERLARVPTEDPALLGSLRSLLGDPRLRLRVADGRNAIEQEDASYDIIQADALRPDMAFSGNLYSVEFFSRMARRLKPRGLMCTWAPTPRVKASFLEAFPHVVEIDYGQVVIGSREPIPLQRVQWRRRLESPEVAAYLGGPEITSRVLEHLQTANAARRDDSSSPSMFNRDLFPRDEFLSPSRNSPLLGLLW